MSFSTPRPGSARESVLIEYFLRRDEISYARDLAHAQLALDPKEGVKRFVDFQNIQFPWLKTAKNREKDRMVDVLKDWAKTGPLNVSRTSEEVRRHRAGISHIRKAASKNEPPGRR